MGNCQAIDAATLVIQHPNGKAEHLYCPVPASHIMKLNPGHYVALLITTTTTTTTAAAATAASTTNANTTNGRSMVRVTRVKLLRSSDMLALGHVYRLITTQEVMKGLVAKKRAKMRKDGVELADSDALKDAEKFAKKSMMDKIHSHRVNRHENGHQSKSTNPKEGGAKPKTWQPSLHSILESTT